VIPALLQGGSSWQHLAGTTGYQPRDICCSAPTGSGKTLAYVIPVVQVQGYKNDSMVKLGLQVNS